MNADLPTQFAARLQQPLPGWQSQVRFQPELSFGRHLGPAPAGARQAAVLVLLYPLHDAWCVPLILRPEHMPDHAGQVSLPGGVIEQGETSQQAALRELHEELGIAADGIRLLGPLSPLYLFASNFQITPWVAATEAYPDWQPNAGEVEHLMEIPLSHLVDPANVGEMEISRRGLTFSAPCFCWESHRIWGATSLVLAEFMAALGETPL